MTITIDTKSYPVHAVLRFSFRPEIVALIRTIPGRKFNKENRCWTIPATRLAAHWKQLERAGFILNEVAFEYVYKYLPNTPREQKDWTLPLYDFQKEGAGRINQTDALLLADAPGLGKSLQTIAGLQSHRNILVLCPASLKYSWADEIKKWDTQAAIMVIDGNKKERQLQWTTFGGGTRVYTIANYELLLHDLQNIPKHWDAIVCDEATRISNTRTKTWKSLATLRAKKRLALTGTPVSNTPVDIFGIMDWLMPEHLGTFKQFSETYTVQDYWGTVIGFKNLTQLRDEVAPYMLRRTKEQVLTNFPAKTVQEIKFELSPKERKIYNDVKNLILEEVRPILTKIDMRSLPMIPVKMLRLKQVTDHVGLVSEGTESTKLEVLRDILKEIIANGDKVIVFTQFSQMAKLMTRELAWPSLRIDGDVPSEERQEIVRQFNTSSTFHILIMTEAGSMGLNLQGASYVVHYDLPWSVAKLTQREDRAHRIGQTKPVTVYKLIARRTIDEYVSAILHKKSSVAAALIDAPAVDEAEAVAATLDRTDIQGILDL